MAPTETYREISNYTQKIAWSSVGKRPAHKLSTRKCYFVPKMKKQISNLLNKRSELINSVSGFIVFDVGELTLIPYFQKL